MLEDTTQPEVATYTSAGLTDYLIYPYTFQVYSWEEHESSICWAVDSMASRGGDRWFHVGHGFATYAAARAAVNLPETDERACEAKWTPAPIVKGLRSIQGGFPILDSNRQAEADEWTRRHRERARMHVRAAEDHGWAAECNRAAADHIEATYGTCTRDDVEELMQRVQHDVRLPEA